MREWNVRPTIQNNINKKQLQLTLIKIESYESNRNQIMAIRTVGKCQNISKIGFGPPIDDTSNNNRNSYNSEITRQPDQLHHQYHYHHRRRSRGNNNRGSNRRRNTHIHEMCQWNLLCSIVILFCCILIKSTGEAKKYQPLANAKLAEQFEETQVVSGGGGGSNIGDNLHDYSSHHIQNRK